MAVAPTGAIYKALKFDNVSSRTYGVYITGEAVYNAPERDVEMITIPGRNGSFALDNGRFQNIEVSYPAGIFAETEADFRQAISDFRNFLCSRKGYVRLQDEYNPNEYRMAVYKSGLEVDPAQLRAGEFEITFDCKPQRWLTSGETEVTIASSGDTITNPTLFETGPLLEVEGYGTIELAGYEIELENATMGEIILANSFVTFVGSTPINNDFSSAALNNGDTITVGKIIFNWRVFKEYISAYGPVSDLSDSNVSFSSSGSYNDRGYVVQTVLQGITRTKGSAETQISNTVTFTQESIGAGYFSCTIKLSDNRLWIKTNVSVSVGRDDVEVGETKGNSTTSLLGNPTYIDCELGEVYKYAGGEPVSLNKYIDLGSDLPKLASGTNTITFDNTITDFKVIPRWWKI